MSFQNIWYNSEGKPSVPGLLSGFISFKALRHSSSVNKPSMESCSLLLKIVSFSEKKVSFWKNRVGSLPRRIKILGFRATLNFQTLKVPLNPMYRMFLTFAKSCILSCLSKFYNKKKFHGAVFKMCLKCLKLKLKVFLASDSVAIVTYCVTKIIQRCTPLIAQFFDTMIVASIDKDRVVIMTHQHSTSWKVLETVLSHLKSFIQ